MDLGPSSWMRRPLVPALWIQKLVGAYNCGFSEWSFPLNGTSDNFFSLVVPNVRTRAAEYNLVEKHPQPALDCFDESYKG